MVRSRWIEGRRDIDNVEIRFAESQPQRFCATERAFLYPSLVRCCNCAAINNDNNLKYVAS